MGSHAGGQRRECEGREQNQAILLQLQSPALKAWLLPGRGCCLGVWLSPPGEACARCRPHPFLLPQPIRVWAMLPPPSSSALVLAAHVPLSLCQGPEDRLGLLPLAFVPMAGGGEQGQSALGENLQV